MWRGAVLIATFGVLVGSAALAQERSDRVRIDDYAAAPAAEPGVALGQIAPIDAPLASDQPLDRTIVLSQPRPPADPQNLAQVGRQGDRTPTRQVGTPGDRSPIVGPALSRPEDRRPAGAERLTGADRCDPQAQNEQERVGCRRILELRAREFSATAPPVLSPEQELLSRQQPAGATISDALSQGRTADDPDKRAAQELGFLVLGPAPPAEPPPENQPAEGSLPEALKGVLVQMGVPQP